MRAVQRAMRAGQRATRREVQKHKPPRGLLIFHHNSEFQWALLFQRAGSTPRTTTTGSHSFTLSVRAISADPPVVQRVSSKLGAPHRGRSLGPLVWGLSMELPMDLEVRMGVTGMMDL
jgi:hypothetical protein